ncbi:hypothetical protein [Photobacterium leiognathi]|uniref:hypothetical protein n=1 Tax=Photobacterium leiognathi TaxID=553611 RepID=UPI002739C230|nr:hypothetical protein [Photobacterium leiognathi]
MSPDDFKKMIFDKGWTVKEVAERWGIKEKSYLYHVIRDKERKEHWNDAVKGLPYIIKSN